MEQLDWTSGSLMPNKNPSMPYPDKSHFQNKSDHLKMNCSNQES